jgi:hypothetical protein
VTGDRDIDRCADCTLEPVALCAYHQRQMDYHHARFQGISGKAVPFADFVATEVRNALWRRDQRARLAAR